MTSYNFIFHNQEQTEAFAQSLWPLVRDQAQKASFNMYLLGNLGAGKSTFSRAFIRAAGYQGNIPSPTYSIQEDYQVDNTTLYHLDLYRLSDPYELDVLGFFDNQKPQTVFLIEWPQMLMQDYPAALVFNWEHLPQQPEARALTLQVDTKQVSAAFLQALEALSKTYAG
ncbi:tRNA (adenosine(37)-N6)-threonylcarbamoyltransferase complex ATPase subunit type 1 TsaE [Psittacicella melopsittaci]|uniref:tRNA threonylcarbamoyladenosine biosynthesis protein TsaE n=1 Tax=Psittacicella melopsittaci TaxID=2028576 RepID=A0A3A1Y4M0_9GAMM|nr:tRNA (adenosine(37)-N6)-threonylcarbamoyltransferase complex ATPase subunit type 1 TsaE [Psittacicella melopsittaci]RIY32340.1 tRNA (adenosine(37)-N6)-threonylcarbamoyltransferase complex ATPase subunit type 1 TsaE [Psittacicella melopsittaci]